MYGYYVKSIHHWTKIGIHVDWIIASASQNGGWFAVNQRYPVLPETVGQYTGLTDKDRNKVYEGDILAFVEENGEMYESEYSVVIHKCASFYLHYGERYDDELLEQYCQTQNVVIGSIHSNPDILERKGN